MKRISIVTPSYNQGAYLEETIKSVLMQSDENIEYIIMDGGSTDDSVEIIKKYEKYINSWVSQKDNGQAWAINKGFEKSSGEILCWINSDDMYLPNTLKTVRKAFDKITEPTIIYGNCIHFNPLSEWSEGSNVKGSTKDYDLELVDYIIQPSSFWNRKAWEIVGQLNDSLNYTFDWDWYIRAKRSGVKFIPIQDYLSIYRIHEEHKTGSGGGVRQSEIENIYKRYNENIMVEAFIKIKSNLNIKRFRRLIRKLKLEKFIDIEKIIHKIFFRKITYREYCSIRKMR